MPRSVLAVPLLVAGVVLTLGMLAACERQAPEDVGSLDTPIVGGKLDTTHRAVVSLLKQVEGGYYPSCSGTLLTQNLVLTARHCVASLNSPDGASVDCDTTEFNETTRPSTMLVSIEANVGSDGLNPYQVAQVWVPPGSSEVCGRDIALLLLSGSGVAANLATPIEPTLTSELAANETFVAVGYGLQDPADETGETAGYRMGVLDAQVFCEGTACETDLVKAGEFIADSPVCSGDSGGPALDKDGRVSGVTSRGDEKCTVGIYSNVSAWREFIIDKTFAAAASGRYAAPAWAGQPPPGTDPGLPSGGTSNSGGTGPVTIAGGPTQPGGGTRAAGGTGSNGSPIIDPLGLSCNGDCPGSYLCWAASGEPPGICVPTCSATQTTCPAEHTCDTTLGACIKPSELPERQTKSAGCSVAAAGTAREQANGLWFGLALLAGSWRGRAAKRRASGT